MILPGLLFVFLAACSEEADPGGPAPNQADIDTALMHVHGLGVNPADEQLYAASHSGVFLIHEGGTVTRIAERWQDTMAFAVVGPDTFLASGHPDQREDLPVHLGLIESTDAARTWSPVSLAGEADFHALEVAGTSIFGFDSQSGRLLVTSDRTTWSEVAADQIIDLAWLGVEPDSVVATTPGGLFEYHVDGTVRRLESAPQLIMVDSPERGVLVGIAADGKVYSSAEPHGGTWTQAAASIPGDPEAFEATPNAWYAASSQGIYRSDDGGTSWEQIYAHER